MNKVRCTFWVSQQKCCKKSSTILIHSIMKASECRRTKLTFWKTIAGLFESIPRQEFNSAHRDSSRCPKTLQFILRLRLVCRQLHSIVDSRFTSRKIPAILIIDVGIRSKITNLIIRSLQSGCRYSSSKIREVSINKRVVARHVPVDGLPGLIWKLVNQFLTIWKTKM